MATMSIGKAWQEAVAFVAREATLLFPVALLFVALPGLILQEMTPPELAAWSLAPTASTMPAVPASYWLGLIVAVLLVWFGSLTLFALALRPGISVGEALRLGFHRLPVLIGTALAVIGALMVVVLAARVEGAGGGARRSAWIRGRRGGAVCEYPPDAAEPGGDRRQFGRHALIASGLGAHPRPFLAVAGLHPDHHHFVGDHQRSGAGDIRPARQCDWRR